MRSPFLVLVAAAAFSTAAPRESKAAPAVVGPVLLTPSLVAPALQPAGSFSDLPIIVQLAHFVETIRPLVPDFVSTELGAWGERIGGYVTGLTARLARLATFQPPNLAGLTAEPIAAAHFCEESSGYGWRNDPIGHFPKFHSGTDFRGKRGTPVLAAGAGTVIFAGRMSGYGNLVIVDHGNGLTTRYAHLSRIVSKKTATVAAGTEIGKMGATGRATGVHLHFEVRLENRPVDPVAALQIAELQRESPTVGNLAAHALSPELMRQASSRIDPPKSGAHAKQKDGKESRPERTGRVRRVRPVS